MSGIYCAARFTAALLPVWIAVAAAAQVGSSAQQGLRALSGSTAAPSDGKQAEICGRAVDVICTPALDAIRVDVDGRASDLVIAIPAADLGQIAAQFDDRYVGREVCATGPVGHFGRYTGVTVASAAELRVGEAAVPLRALSPAGLPLCDSGISGPVPVHAVSPQYTSDAMRARISGAVLVEAIVLPDGRVGDTRILRMLDPGLDEAAIRAVEQWQFRPATREGESVAVHVTVELHFTMR